MTRDYLQMHNIKHSTKMKLRTILSGFALLALTACTSDLDTLPLDDNQLTSNNVYATANGYRGVLAKCYASLIQTGQKGGDGGDGDVNGIDEGYSGYTRCLFYLQEASTDEILFHAGSGHGSLSMYQMNWNPSTKVISYPYYRLYMAINYCNEFLRNSTDDQLSDNGVFDQLSSDIKSYRAEARLIRAYCYSMICDLYGDAPFVDDSQPLGIIPEQKSRKEIFDYVVSEVESLVGDLPAAGKKEYGRVDQAAAWFLLARHYLNAEVWTGTAQYNKAYQYAKQVISSGAYPLASDWRHIFLADNNTCSEIIWGLVQDADNAQGSAGTNFLIKALVNGAMNGFYATGVGTRGWGNGRAKVTLVDKFDEHDQTFSIDDPWGDNKYDKRAQFFDKLDKQQKNTWTEGKDFQKTFTVGYNVIKWRNVTKDRKQVAGDAGTVYSSVDFPLFRTADAYLMAAEAILRGGGGSRSEALQLVNEVRNRAYLSGSYGNSAVSGAITDAQLTLDFLLDERARELYTENVRRTDLIRFSKYTKGYNWDWKGSDGKAGNYVGKDVDDKYKLFPIPQDEFTVNPYLKQNPDYAN